MDVMSARNWMNVQRVSMHRVMTEQFQPRYRLCLFGNMERKLFLGCMIGYMRGIDPAVIWHRNG